MGYSLLLNSTIPQNIIQDSVLHAHLRYIDIPAVSTMTNSTYHLLTEVVDEPKSGIIVALNGAYNATSLNTINATGVLVLASSAASSYDNFMCIPASDSGITTLSYSVAVYATGTSLTSSNYLLLDVTKTSVKVITSKRNSSQYLGNSNIKLAYWTIPG